MSASVALLAVAAEAASEAERPAALFARGAEMGRDGRSIIYSGEVVRLSRDYSSSYEDYVADPDNIDPTENAHVERLMTRAHLPRQFANRDEAFSAVMRLKFPGYGMGRLRTGALPASREWAVLAFEIPRARKSRYVAIAEDAQGWLVIDDFVADDQLSLNFAERSGGQIIYSDRKDQKVLVHTVQGHAAP